MVVDERGFLQRSGYGNADPSGGIGRFWLEDPRRISAIQQVAFPRRLYRNEQPFAVGHKRLVKDVLVAEAIARRVLQSIAALP